MHRVGAREIGVFLWIKLGLFALLISLPYWVQAQYFPGQSLYMFDKYRHNLAYAGFDGTVRMNGSVRRQWDGIEGAPQEDHFSVHLPLFQINGAAGMRMYSEKVGAHQDFRMMGTFSYVYDRSSLGLFALGGGLGLQNRRLDGSLLTTPDGDYGPGGSGHNDPLLSQRLESFTRPIFSLAAYFANDFFDAGLQIEQLYAGSYTVRNTGEILYDNKPTFSAFAQYNLWLSEDLTLLPSFLAKSDGSQFQLDLNFLARINQRFFAGAGYRGFDKNSSDAIIVTVGVKTNNRIDVYYSYDFTISGIREAASGTHEVIVSYLLGRPVGIKVPQPIKYNPRFF
jgi:type IX secretion system PorP/SprF family membrane protein